MKMPEYVTVKIKPDKKGTSYSLEVVSDTDFVNVVRCKDCKHWIDVTEVEDGVRYAECELFSDEHEFGENWFCKDGERREVTE